MIRILIATLINLPLLLAAGPINKTTAIKLALNFMEERVTLKELKTNYRVSGVETYTEQSGKTLIYAINMQPQGFVLVSADDAAFPVPAYSYEGSWDKKNNNPGIALWLGQYESEMSNIVNSAAHAREFPRNPAWDHYLTGTKASRKDYRSVEPLLTSTWDQDYPYNQQCPADPTGVAGHAVVGCVATACAQLMYYFRFPEHGTGSYSYYHPDYDTISVDFSAATYEWDKMTDYTYVYNEEIAEISYHFGASVDMVYGPNSSGMYNHKAAYSLRTHFNYSPQTQYVFRDSTNMDWDSLLVTHLDRDIPMYYAGWAAVGSSSGHAFIADGYEITPQGKHYHFNWGWGGTLDGYFYTDNLTPGGAQFTFAQELIINAYPDTVSFTYPEYCSGTNILDGKAGTIDDGSGPTRDYQVASNCSWLIQPQSLPQDSISSITLDFTRFNTESGQDILSIYDGQDETAPILGTYSGSNIPSSVNTSGNTAFITFTSDNQTNGAGFLLKYEAIAPDYCTNLASLTAPSGTFDDGSGTKFYSNNTLCRWLIEPAGAVEVTLSFTAFNTEANMDLLRVYDWGTQTLLGEFSGDQLPPVVTASSGSMYLEFTTDSDINGEGWAASYTASAAGIEEGSVRSEIWPNPARDFFRYSFTGGERLDRIRIYSGQGKLLMESTTDSNEGIVSWDNLIAGLYFVVFEGSNIQVRKKLLIH